MDLDKDLVLGVKALRLDRRQGDVQVSDKD